jgi:hypothetical protein
MPHCMPAGVEWETCLWRTACTFYIGAHVQDYRKDQCCAVKGTAFLVSTSVYLASCAQSPVEETSHENLQSFLAPGCAISWRECGVRGKWNECPWRDKLDACILVLFIYIRLTVKDVSQLRMWTGLHPKCACFDLAAVTGGIRYYIWHIHFAVSELPGW